MNDAHESSASAEPDPRLGTTLDGRYRLIRRLGAGGFGVVYEAEHEVIRRKVAVKMLHASFAAEPEVMARFRREAIAATTIGHPHIVEVLDMGRADDGAAYMVLELLEGRDWAVVLEEGGPQPLGRTIHILLQVLDGLAAAHDKGIIHRDLKAENVFLITRGNDADFVKIVDFGISKIMEEGGTKDVVLTHTGMAMGTPVAMSPEQFQGKKDVDRRADLWAVGVMLYRALTASWPFGGETYAMLAVNVMTEHPRPLAELRPDVPGAIADVVGRLLEKDRARRYQTAGEVRAALEPFAGDRTPPPTGPLGTGFVSTRVGVSAPEGLALDATGLAHPTPADAAPKGASPTPAGPTPPGRTPTEPAPTGPAPTEAITTPPALPVGTQAPAPSPALVVGGLAIGALLVGGTWWVATSTSQPTLAETSSPTALPSPDAPTITPDAALVASPTAADADDHALEAEAPHPHSHGPRPQGRHVVGGVDIHDEVRVSPPVTTEPVPATPEPPPRPEPPVTASPEPPATTSPEPPATTPPTTSRPGLRRPGSGP